MLSELVERNADPQIGESGHVPQRWALMESDHVPRSYQDRALTR